MQYPLKQACCGCKLRTGAVIVGYVSIISGTLMISEGVWMIRSFEKLRREMNEDPEDVKHRRRPCCDQWVLDVAGFVAICLGVLLTLTSFALMLGIKKRWLPLVLQWPVSAAVARLCWLALVPVAVAAALAPGGDYAQYLPLWILIIPGLISAGMETYFILVVHSFYRQLVDELKPPAVVAFVA